MCALTGGGAGLTGVPNQFDIPQFEQGFLHGKPLAIDYGPNSGRQFVGQRLLVMTQGVLLAALALGQKFGVIFGASAGFELAPAGFLDAAQVTGFRRLPAETSNVSGQFTREVRALPGDAGEAKTEIGVMATFGSFSEPFFAVIARRNKVVQDINHVGHRMSKVHVGGHFRRPADGVCSHEGQRFAS